jgi:hypothetical protein
VKRIAPAAVASTLLLAPCALTHDASRAGWTSDWNERVESASTPFEHPCATRAFIAWADGFLADCEAGGEADAKPPAPGCDARLAWVRARVEQCRPWTAWQLRNFNKHERSDGPPPSARIE